MDGQNQISMFDDPVRFRDGELPESTDHTLVPYTHHALRSAKIDDIHTRADLIKELAKHIPTNEFGLPIYIYRADLLDVSTIISSMKRGDATFVDEMLSAAVVHIWYTQGFPTLKDETPLWGKLDYEAKESYDAFLAYAEQVGVRNLQACTAWPPEQLQEWFYLNFWMVRARALDIFKAAHHARLREHRIMSLEGNHFVEGERIFKRLVRAIEGKSDSELKELEIDKLINALEKVTKIQRASVGLGSTPGVKGAEIPKATSVEVTLREAANYEAKPLESDEFDATLLADPEIIRQAQELIIKVNR